MYVYVYVSSLEKQMLPYLQRCLLAPFEASYTLF